MQNTETQNIQPIPLVGLSQFRVTSPNYLIKGFMEYDTNNVIYGESGAGKSFLTLDAGFAVAASSVINSSFFGMPIAESGPVVYACGEGQNGIAKRLEGLKQKYKVTPEQADQIPFYMTGQGVILNNATQLQQLLMTCEQIKAHHGKYPVMIIFDTLNKSFQGNENSADDMGELVRAMDELRRITKAAVVMVHHTGKGGEIRGSSALRAGIDNQIGVFLNEENDNTIIIKNDKMKDAGKMEDSHLNKKVVRVGWDDRYNEEITTLILENDAFGNAKAPQQEVKESKTEKLIASQKETLTLLVKEMGDNTSCDEGQIIKAFEENYGFSKKQTKQKFAGLIGKKVIDIKNNTITLTL